MNYQSKSNGGRNPAHSSKKLEGKNMKQIFIALAVLLVASLSYGKSLPVKQIVDGNYASDGIAVYELTDATIDSINDSLPPAGNHIYGPIPLTKRDCDPAVNTQLYVFNTTCASGDSMQTAYAICSSPNFADIISYTALDTIVGTTGKKSANISTASLAGKYLFIKLTSIDASRIYLKNRIRVVTTYDCK
jgi:hypothetical protein